MVIKYPDEGFDDFVEPTLPEDTPLSSAGSGDRNHVEHHRDLGDAVEKIERNASLKGHDHSGDGDDIAHGDKLDQANTHQNADTDSGINAIHHTLGLDSGQAAAGNHTHDYSGNSILNKPYERCTSIARPTPQLGKMIWEVDTNRMRVWSQFPGVREAVQGLYSIDDLERVSTANLGPTLWKQTYLPIANLLHGKMATPDGHAAAWIEQGDEAQRCIAQRINPADRYTQSHDQVITFNTNDHVQDRGHANADNPNTNDVYFRMSDDGQTYVRAALTWWKGAQGALMLTYTTTGPVGEQLIGQLPAESDTPNITWQFRLVGNKFEAWMGISPIGTIQDNTNAVMTGYKGWGFGMQAGDPVAGHGQTLPNEISEVGISDAVYYTSSANWQLLPVGEVPRLCLLAGREQRINNTGSLVEWDTVMEDNFGYYRPGIKTGVTVTEPGLYHVHASIAWGTNLLGDHAGTVITINDQPTANMHWAFVRGNTYVAGFCQTVDVTCYLRLAKGDRVGVAAAHNGKQAQYTGYKKSDQITQMSRFFMCFVSP